MTENDWTTTSVKLTRDIKLKLDKYCEMEKTTPNKFLRNLIEKELAFMLDSSKLREGKGMPLVGQHLFSYNFEKDVFKWEIEIGNKKSVISEEMPVVFIESLKSAIDVVLGLRDEKMKKFGLNKKKVIIPKDLMKFEVRE